MDRQPILDGDRLTLRPLRADDWTALFAVASDPKIWALHPAHDRWREPVFRAFFDDALESGGALVMTDKTTGTIIGSSRYGVPGAEGPGEIEIGWTFLARSYWGSGWNAQAKRLMLAHALAFVDRVIFQIGIDNVVSRRAMANIGGRLIEGRSRLHERGGAMVEHVFYEITPESFATGPLSRR
ncbi:GNAT family N-acetyltransferase [Novosphingobium gossypii]|uniref:GNAT family N-acetyltransferase n=1 Tax=Novosphingobium gossypii TaxID=1604774 RepID=UPI003D256A12